MNFPTLRIGSGTWSIITPPGYQSGGIEVIWRIIRFTITLLLTVGTTAFLLMFLIGGIRWITSGGDKEGMAKAKGTVTSALIGLILLFSSFFFLGVIQTFFGVDLGVTITHFGTTNDQPNPGIQ